MTIEGQPARLAVADGDEEHPDHWYVVGQFPDGPLFLLLAPETLTREPVPDIGEQVTYTP